MSCQEVCPPAYFLVCFLCCWYKGNWLKISSTKLKALSRPVSCFQVCVPTLLVEAAFRWFQPQSNQPGHCQNTSDCCSAFIGSCLAISKFSAGICCMVLCSSQLSRGNPLLHASFHLRQTDGNTFGRCILMAVVRVCSLNKNAIFHLSLHRDFRCTD